MTTLNLDEGKFELINFLIIEFQLHTDAIPGHHRMIEIGEPLNSIDPQELENIADRETSLNIRLITESKSARLPIQQRELHQLGILRRIILRPQPSI